MSGAIILTGVIQMIQIVLYSQSQIITSGNYYSDQSAYECGFTPLGDARDQFDIQYYIIGIQYQIFDQEIVQIFPLSIVISSIENIISQLLGMAFLFILTIGFIYEYKLGALDINTRS